MSRQELLAQIKAYWDATSDSAWYQSLRSEAQIRRLKEAPGSAFHPAVLALIRRYCPELKGRRVLLPSSGDNHAAFALALMGAQVTSSDISERQLAHAADIAGRLGLAIEFVCDDTMQLSRIRDQAYDLVYTSNGTLTWISDPDSMYRQIGRVLKPGGHSIMYDLHPFNRPFSGEAWEAPRIVKSYHDVLPAMHWRLQDLINAQIRAGLRLCELAELPAVDASFWFSWAELQHKCPEELEGINAWKRHPMPALPAWVALVSEKA